MCGILGVVAERGAHVELPRRTIEVMRDTMIARGPDACGIYCQDNVAFAHRRLAIRDLEGGTQPWHDRAKRAVLVYNGELYNDVELRRELEDTGVQFRTRCDTEVVLEAYLAWGSQCVERFQGMFAFGIYDFRDDSLFLARDRFGVKPLFFAEVDGTLAFASSIPALVAHPQIDKRPNFAAISHYLTTFRLTLDRETCFASISQLLPGETLVRRRGSNTIGRYWEYPTTEDEGLSYDDAVEQLRASLDDAVQRRLVSDVPVGMFLSGGVDSNTLACLVHRVTKDPFVGYCGGGTTQPLSEDFKHARICAAHVGFDYREVHVDASQYLSRWQWMVEQYDTPVATPSDVVIFEIAAKLKESVGVALGGEGADELLCGYAVQHWAGNDFAASRRLASGQWRPDESVSRRFREAMCGQYGRDTFLSEIDHYFALNSLIPIAAKPALLQAWVWEEAEEDSRMVQSYQGRFDRLADMPTVQKYQRLLHQVNLESLLSRLDSSTMLASLEARVPYTDHRLVEQMFRVPFQHKIDIASSESEPYLPSADLEARGSLRSKRVLRNVAGQLMPEQLASRKKASFPTPVQSWLAGEWHDWARNYLSKSPFAQSIFQPQAINDLANNIPQAGMWLWPMLNIAIWGDQQMRT
jgi:asparagine synthase (glutamine-hydrolysing)